MFSFHKSRQDGPQGLPPVEQPRPGESSRPRQLASGTSAKVVDKQNQVPPFQVVLTATGERLAQPESVQTRLALLHFDGKNTCLVTEEFYHQNAFLSFRSRARTGGYSFDDTDVLFATSSVLDSVYRRHAQIKSGDAGQDKVQQETALRAMFYELINAAVAKRASDVHVFVPMKEGDANSDKPCVPRFRIDGRLRKWREFSSAQMKDVLAFAYTELAEGGSRNNSNVNLGMPLNCMIPIEVGGVEYKLRYNGTPALGGYDVVMRVIDATTDVGVTKTLEDLGYLPSQLRQLALAARKTIGLIIFAGVTGSGKTTSLNVMMKVPENRDEKKIYTLEDPPEYRNEEATQIIVQGKSEDKERLFKQAMDDILRMDPDVIMAGEIRNRDFGSNVKALVQTGHQVYTTVHAASVFDVFERITSDEIAIPRATVASRNFITAVVYQALVRVNCRHCKRPATEVMSDERLSLIEQKFSISRARIFCVGKGCEECDGMGAYGRMVAAEILVPDDEQRRLIRLGQDTEAESNWRLTRRARFDEEDTQGKTAFEVGMYRVAEGTIDPRELEEAFSPIESYVVHRINADEGVR